ncbi:MAG: ADP-heptose--LPS heptosyltransferase [Ignavibacteria bacterium GWB2_35_6b]|nr:MAG: ADP-heptose--LPS heptosyltransferase [Ignavibacteria bacterium GWB2_35_6b]
MNEPKNILLVRTDRIGDVILSLPLVEIIKKHYPNSKVTFLLRNYTKALAENYPGIDNVLILKEENGNTFLFENISEIKKHNFDSCIIVYPTFKIALILFLSGIKNRIGTGYRWYSFFFNKKIYEHRKYGEKHELEYNVALLNKLGIDEKINENTVSFNIQVQEHSEQFVRKILAETNYKNELPTVIIHPGSSGSAVDLPISKFKELASLMAQQLKANIVLTGSESEKNICNEINEMNNFINLAGKFDLSQLIAVINKSDLLIANSTGPIHIAAALGKNVIGFYPKIAACSPNRWGPYTNKKNIFMPEITCSNCTKKQCEKLNCMNSININEVFEAAKKITIDN